MTQQPNKLDALEQRWQEQRAARDNERRQFEAQVQAARRRVADNGGKAPSIPTSWDNVFTSPEQAKAQRKLAHAEMAHALGVQPGQYAFSGQGMRGPGLSAEAKEAIINGK